MTADRGWKLRVTPLASLLLLLLLNADPSLASRCLNENIDLVIAIDTSFSCSDAEFRNLLSQVKDIASGFKIGPNGNRVALIGMSETAQLLANFNDISSAVDFNSHVDKLVLTRKPASISAGMKLARESVLNAPKRDAFTQRLLILVKDRKCAQHLLDTDDAELESMRNEAAALKQMNCTIHAAGVGGLWLTKDIESIFGREYLLLNDRSKAMQYSQSVSTNFCPSDCKNTGRFEIQGECYKSVRQTLHVEKAYVRTSLTTARCGREISRSFGPCISDGSPTCGNTKKVIETCDSAGQASVHSRIEFFDQRNQTCMAIKSSETLSCSEAKECKSQVADLIILLDQSMSAMPAFRQMIQATETLIKSLNIGIDNVRIEVCNYTTKFLQYPRAVRLENWLGKDAILKVLNEMKNTPYSRFGYSNTGEAFNQAHEKFVRRGRSHVAKAVLVITDGGAEDPGILYDALPKLKQMGVTVYAVGLLPVGGRLNMDTLNLMTSPETKSNLYIIENVTDLQPWADKFSERLCIDLAPTNPRLCEVALQHKSISPCLEGKTHIYSMEYKFDAEKNCVKNLDGTVVNKCDEAKDCKSQAADLIILLDQSLSAVSVFRHMLEATETLIKSLNVGPDNIRIEVRNHTSQFLAYPRPGGLGQGLGRDAILKLLHEMKSIPYPRFGGSYNGEAFNQARETFLRDGRPNVTKMILAITDGVTHDHDILYHNLPKLKKMGVIVYAVGVLPVRGRLNMDLLNLMTAPETESNLFIFNNVADLIPWAEKFSERLCIDLGPTNPMLCEAELRRKSVSPCLHGRTNTYSMEYKFDADKKCVKHLDGIEVYKCDNRCTDPIDGWVYVEGESWTNLCHEFSCRNGQTDGMNTSSTKCIAADFSCKAVGSPPFACRGIDGKVTANCRCVDGKRGATLFVED